MSREKTIQIALILTLLLLMSAVIISNIEFKANQAIERSLSK